MQETSAHTPNVIARTAEVYDAAQHGAYVEYKTRSYWLVFHFNNPHWKPMARLEKGLVRVLINGHRLVRVKPFKNIFMVGIGRGTQKTYIVPDLPGALLQQDLNNHAK